jgi:hypothetical protein
VTYERCCFGDEYRKAVGRPRRLKEPPARRVAIGLSRDRKRWLVVGLVLVVGIVVGLGLIQGRRAARSAASRERSIRRLPRGGMRVPRRVARGIGLCAAICFAGAWALVVLDVHGATLRLAYAAVLLAAFGASAVFHWRSRGLTTALKSAAWDTFWAGLIVAPALVVAVLLVVDRE